jgi:hypothetical protein
MRNIILLFLSLFLLISTAAWAENNAKSSFEQISNCVQKGYVDDCHGLLTASSEPLYTRFVNYDLVSCLPKDIGYISQKKSGNHVIIRSSVSVGDNTRYTRLAFVEEEGQWKLDVPESLRIGMGEDWQRQIDATEQIYLMLRKQMGNQLNCGMIENLAMINKKK